MLYKNIKTGKDKLIELKDTPNSYTGFSNKVLKVNSIENGVEFGDPPPPSSINLSQVNIDVNKDWNNKGIYNSIYYGFSKASTTSLVDSYIQNSLFVDKNLNKFFIKRGLMYIPLEWEYMFPDGDYVNYAVYLFTSHIPNGNFPSLTFNSAYVVSNTATRENINFDESIKTYYYKFTSDSQSYMEISDQNPDYSNGLTIIGVMRYRDIRQPWSRFIDLGAGQPGDNIIVAHEEVTDTFFYEVYVNTVSGGKVSILSSIEPNIWFSFVILQNGGTAGKQTNVSITMFKQSSSGSRTIRVNGQTSLPRRITRRCYIGKSNWDTDGYLEGDIVFFGLWNYKLDNELGEYIASSLLDFYTIY